MNTLTPLPSLLYCSSWILQHWNIDNIRLFCNIHDVLSQSPAFFVSLFMLYSCRWRWYGLFRSQSGDLLPAQHWVSSLWPTSAIIKLSLCSEKMWGKTFSSDANACWVRARIWNACDGHNKRMKAVWCYKVCQQQAWLSPNPSLCLSCIICTLESQSLTTPWWSFKNPEGGLSTLATVFKVMLKDSAVHLDHIYSVASLLDPPS